MVQTGHGLLQVSQRRMQLPQLPVSGSFGVGTSQLMGHYKALFQAHQSLLEVA